jgi:hypothetical protein
MAALLMTRSGAPEALRAFLQKLGNHEVACDITGNEVAFRKLIFEMFERNLVTSATD